MRTRSACRCLLCKLELHLKQELRQSARRESYSKVADSNLLLSGFPTALALTAHLRTCRSNGNASHPADAILLELLHLRRQEKSDILLRDIFLLAFIPVLHSASRQIAKRYGSVPPDDMAQHLVATFLEALDSAVLRDRNSHLAFALSRLVRRNAFNWAKHENHTPGSAHRDDPLPEPIAPWGIPEPLERATLLRHFLFRCQREGFLTGPDLELLVHIKLEGKLSESDGSSAVYSNALRQKVKRLLRKLREAARLPSSAVRRQDSRERK
jgi:hypothetical protein